MSRIDLDLAASGILNKHVLAALSGGADSVALVFLLNEKRLKGEIRLTLAHFEHGIRGEESKKDQAFAAALAERLGLPLITESANVCEEARKTGEGLETCARRLRHEFLNRARGMCSADVIATAHHKGDQAETVLMHVLRGGGLTGAKGMREKDDLYARPLLRHSKKELIQYLLSIGESWREDQTNFIKDNPRNCLRLDVMPQMKKAYPGAEDALCRFSEIARDEDEYMNQQAMKALCEMAERYLGVWILKNTKQYPIALVRRVIKKIAPQFGFDEIEKIRTCLSRVSLPGGWRAHKKNECIFVEPPFEAIGETPLSPDEKTVFGDVCEIEWTDEKAEKSDSVVIERINPAPLAGACVRTRRDGDFMRPLGMLGKTKLLSDILTDRKIPLPLKDRIPVIAKGKEVFWIVGYDISQSIKTDENTKAKSIKAILHHGYGGDTK
ncbi:MAG: tRNA lysidine(34) synthetase TilS [Clostridia bacterium]|nr:tRNA lysidine(34) synthetase TilS [Clostridia bacterium]